MLDIDHFKAFNDVHGHAGGDALLAQFGKLLAEHSRGEDIACRYGGEEFTLILPEAPAGAALQRATAICSAVEAMRVQHMGRELPPVTARSEEHTSELQSLMRISYAVFCLKKKTTTELNNKAIVRRFQVYTERITLWT